MVGFDSRKDMSQGNGRALTVATTRSEGVTLERSDTVLTIGRLKLRGKTDDLPQYVVECCNSWTYTLT